MLLSEGQTSDFKGAASMLAALPRARDLLGDKGYDAGWFRQALAERGIAACIPSKSNRKIPIEHDRKLYRQRHKIDIDQAWRLSRFCGWGGMGGLGPWRDSAPRRRGRADGFQGRDGVRIGQNQLGALGAAVGVAAG